MSRHDLLNKEIYIGAQFHNKNSAEDYVAPGKDNVSMTLMLYISILKYIKGHNYVKTISGVMLPFSAHRLMTLYICTNFKNISKGFTVIERTRLKGHNPINKSITCGANARLQLLSESSN